MSLREAVKVPEVSASSPVSFAPPLGGFAKRSLDVVLASILLISIAPLLLIVIVALRSMDRGPIFFRHTRLGYNGRPFGCLKIRTMATNSAEVLERILATDPAAAREWAESQKLANDPRITPFGRILRKTSIDELPQLINVIRGEMSLVGPRPIVASEADRYGSRFACYQAARPGITGLWQISGRSDCSYAERIGYDTQYANNWSMMGDLVILAKTVGVVVTHKGSC